VLRNDWRSYVETAVIVFADAALLFLFAWPLVLVFCCDKCGC
jgi:hypothetical protein